MVLVKEIYNVTKQYPKDELFILVQQTKRAAISIPANIAEGFGRNHKKDSVQFLHISRGSLYELETHILLAKMFQYIKEEVYDNIVIQINECLRLINGLINYMEKQII